MSRPYTYVGEHPAQNERFGIYGVFKSEKCIVNIWNCQDMCSRKIP